MFHTDNNPTTFKVLTPKQVAKALQVSPKTLEVWRRTRAHDLPYIMIGRAIRYDPSDVRAFLQSNMKGGCKIQ